jgi:thiosulfate dehydrogenase [quinone] large subunit
VRAWLPVAEKQAVEEKQQTAQKRSPLSRRQLFTLLGITGSTAIASVAALSGLHFLQAQKVVNAQNTIPLSSTMSAQVMQGTETSVAEQSLQKEVVTRLVLAHSDEVPVNSAKTFPIANQKRPGVLVRLADESFVAFNSTCTHAACGVSYSGETHLLECPCHGAAFDPARKAMVVRGPAQKPLTPIDISVNADGTITMK